jgi:lipopolysaccharide/colanic/teichoic acid biosynthesis glycosyltransferase
MIERDIRRKTRELVSGSFIRFLDVLLSALALLVFFPFWLILVLILRFTGEGEIFYVQERIGREGKPFGLIKFATMLKNSPLTGTGDITVKNDLRILPLGRILRKTKLNEIPQFINVLFGDMSIVGPRPQTPQNFEYFPPEAQKLINAMRPGLTGIGSIVFRDEESIVAGLGKPVETCYREIIGPYKAKLEEWYWRRRKNAGVYCLLILVTVWIIINPKSKIYRRIWPSLPPMPEPVK